MLESRRFSATKRTNLPARSTESPRQGPTKSGWKDVVDASRNDSNCCTHRSESANFRPISSSRHRLSRVITPILTRPITPQLEQQLLARVARTTIRPTVPRPLMTQCRLRRRRPARAPKDRFTTLRNIHFPQPQAVHFTSPQHSTIHMFCTRLPLPQQTAVMSLKFRLNQQLRLRLRSRPIHCSTTVMAALLTGPN